MIEVGPGEDTLEAKELGKEVPEARGPEEEALRARRPRKKAPDIEKPEKKRRNLLIGQFSLWLLLLVSGIAFTSLVV